MLITYQMYLHYKLNNTCINNKVYTKSYFFPGPT